MVGGSATISSSLESDSDSESDIKNLEVMVAVSGGSYHNLNWEEKNVFYLQQLRFKNKYKCIF